MKGTAFLQLILGSTIEKDHQNCTKEEGNMGLTNKKGRVLRLSTWTILRGSKTTSFDKIEN